MNVSLTNKKIFITGGTSTLGSAFIRKAIHEGAEIYFTFCSDKKTADDLIRLGAKGIRVDFLKQEDLISVKTFLASQTKSLDGLIHNAAITRDRTIQNLEESEWDEAIHADLRAVYYLTKELLRFLLKSEQSRILMLTSQVGLHGGYGQAAYAAAKGGMIALTKTLAKELGKRKILVNALNPGFMESKMTKNLPKDVEERNRKRSVLGEISTAEEVSDFMIYLMSDQMKRVSGQIFHMESRIV